MFVGIAFSLLVIAAGAILALAVDVNSSSVDVELIGWILFVIGIIGLILSLIFGSAWFSSLYGRNADERRGPPPPPA